jgi:hypothetical protein
MRPAGNAGKNAGNGGGGDGREEKITFAMTPEDLAFLASAMEFLASGLSPAQENLWGFWQLTFQRALDEHFHVRDDDPAAEDSGL